MLVNTKNYVGMERGCCCAKHSRPDITNTTQKLSKVSDSANRVVFVKMHDIIKYVLKNQKPLIEVIRE